ncbi:MAG: hypothetical protein IKH77_03420 [Clostridia bacterium]|nr:hypothetical protein [Clostridia bacterium]
MKKLSVGAWITCIAAVLAIVALFVFMGNTGSGYFKDNKPANFELYVILGAVALVGAIALKTGVDNKWADLAAGVLQVAGPVLLALALITLVGTRVEGLGFIYFSNADVAKEVQTAENLASGSGAIANMVLLGCATLLGIVGAFCNLRKKGA